MRTESKTSQSKFVQVKKNQTNTHNKVLNMYEPSLHIWVSGAKQRENQVMGFTRFGTEKRSEELMFEAAEVCWTY